MSNVQAPGPVPGSVDALDEVGATLLQSASTLLADEGAAALTVRRIAAEAGMSTMNVYSRFGGKHGVVEHLYLRGFALLADGMERVPTTDDSLADLDACGQSYRRFALDHPTLYSVMFDRVVPDYEPSPPALEAAGSTLQQLADRLERAMRMGRIRTADPVHTAAMVWGTCHGVVSLELKSVGPPGIDWAEVFANTCAALVRGLAA